jgi:hypothetical protein
VVLKRPPTRTKAVIARQNYLPHNNPPPDPEILLSN